MRLDFCGAEIKMRIVRITLIIILAAICAAQKPARSGLHTEDMDTSCKPCSDFWRYANGTWLDKNPVPTDRSAWGTIQILIEANRQRMRTILDTAANQRNAAPGMRRLGDYYAGCLNTPELDKLGYKPLESDFARIAAIKNMSELAAAFAYFQKVAEPWGPTNSVGAPFRFLEMSDPENAKQSIVAIEPSALSLEDRDYYLADDERSKRIRAAFLDQVTNLLALAGAPRDSALIQARSILNLETKLAAPELSPADKRDVTKSVHILGLSDLQMLAPNVNWTLVFRELGLAESTRINVSEPEALKKVGEEMAAEPLESWKGWLRWRDIQLSARYLSKPFVDELFHFQGTVLSGITQPPPRWRTCTRYADRDLSDDLGQAYSAKYFPVEAKRRMLRLVENLRSAFQEQIQESDWMGAEAKRQAVAKLKALRIQIGYPDLWHDYSAIKISRADFLGSVRNAWRWKFDYEMSKVGKSNDGRDWGDVTAPTADAFSDSPQLKVIFPAGILQPPYFDMAADDAVNYGAIGSIIGHELGHHFDDQGSKFDAAGRMKDWWTADDRREYEKRTACVIEQFNSIDLGGGLHHNGKLVLGEALGDLTGVRAAYRAFQNSLRGKPGPVIDGFASDQRFFIAFARNWAENEREEARKQNLDTNPHPLMKWRANASLQNMPEFRKAFQCGDGDAMVRSSVEQCRLW